MPQYKFADPLGPDRSAFQRHWFGRWNRFGIRRGRWFRAVVLGFGPGEGGGSAAERPAQAVERPLWPVVTFKVEPEYWGEARKAKFQGTA